jgi:hypothetical protein
MTSHLLRLEAVNLASFVYDTSRLPTIRGGSRLLLEAVGAAEGWLEAKLGKGRVETISRGASAGLFRLTSDDAAKLRGDLEDWLGRHEEFRHATFVVDVTPETDKFRKDVETLIARNRFRQMRSPSLAIPSGTAKLPCSEDKVRPATRTRTKPGEQGVTEWVSPSVAVRLDHGRDLKQAFYEKETGRPWDLAFAQDFQELAADDSRGKLDGKMAVLYLDGNHFGKVQQDVCMTAEKQQAFDGRLRELRRGFLTALLEEIAGNPLDWLSLQGTQRFETLLWGGDDLLLVAPAWKGFWLAEFFFEQSRDWAFEDHPLRHAGGLVLCHSNAPIRRIKAVAENLADAAKGVDRTRNLLAYQVLESFDVVGSDFESFRAARSPGGTAPGDLVLAGERLAELTRAVAELVPVLPHGRVHRLAAAIVAGRDGTAEADSLARFARQEGKDADLATLLGAAATPAAAWLHLAELWDYREEAIDAPG